MTDDNLFVDDDSEELFSADGLLDAKPTKRARTLLYLIESQTVKLVRESQQVAMNYLPVTRDTGIAYLRAFADVELAEPSIQELEAHAEDWAYLVSDNPVLQASLAHLMAEKYDLVRNQIQSIRVALNLDAPIVKGHYQSFYTEALENIYSPEKISLSWLWTRISKQLENMPTFWVTFFLTLPIGPGLLALPIAMARMGVVPGIILLIFFGFLNMFTAGAIAESFARTGEGRYSFAFMGRLVEYYLGRSSSGFLTFVLALDLFLVLIVFYLGIATSLAALTGIAASVWVVIAFTLGAFFLSRGSFNATIASSIVIGIFNIGLVIIISVLPLGNIEISRLTMMTLPIGDNFDMGIIELIFGMMLTAYCNHLLIGNYAKVALRRDPSSRSFINGSMASIAVTIVLSCLWLISMNGSIDPEILVAEKGTVLVPLADIVGGWVNVLGSVFIMLSLGLASIHVSFGLYFIVQERLEQFAKFSLFGDSLKNLLQKRFGRFALGMLPIVLSMLATLYFVQTGSVSFSVLLNFLGVVGLALFAGIYPIQLLVSSRFKGNVVLAKVYGILGNRILLVVSYLVFLASILAHGLFIWTDPIQRLGAIIVGVFVIITTFTAYREGAFKPRMVVEVRKKDDELAIVALISCGKPAKGDVLLNYSGDDQPHRNVSEVDVKLLGLQTIHVTFDASNMHDLEIWVHHLLADSSSTAQSAKVYLASGAKALDVQGQLIVPVDQSHYDLKIQLQ